MKTKGLVLRWGVLASLLLTLSGGLVTASAALYKSGDIVTNFTLIDRLPWTTVSGQFFDYGMPLHLSDLGGSVVFMEFFDAT